MALGNSSVAFGSNSQLSEALSTVNNDRILVIVRLFGGNDGLNTIVPVNQYNLYADARPTLKIPENQLWTLKSGYAMPNYMGALQKLWGDGHMKVVNSVGYPNLSHSHFKGSDIWATADMGATQSTGIMGSYFEALHPDYLITPPDSPTAIEIGGRKNLTFYGENSKYSFHASSPAKLEHIANAGVTYDMKDLPTCVYGDRLSYVRGLANSTYKYSGVVSSAYKKSSDDTVGRGYATNDIGKSLGIASRLIKGGLGTKVYMITANGYDTHTHQLLGHKELMMNLSQSIAHFYDDLKRQGLQDKVLTMCVSEFGRRLKENGAQGTDHGSAGPVMLFGSGLNGNGVVGKHSSLKTEDLYDNNKHLQWHTDFRSVYESILTGWMQIDANTVKNIMLGGDFPNVDLGFSSNSKTGTFQSSSFSAKTSQLAATQTIANTVDARVIYGEDESYVSFNNTTSQNVNVTAYTFSGQQIGVIFDNFMLSGEQRIPLDMDKLTDLYAGRYYILRIHSDSFSISKKFVSRQ